jgi:cytoskeletal protein CcmA (bactofilin family)
MIMPTEPSKAPKQTVVEEGTEFKGTLKSSCAVVINGTVDGEMDAPEITVSRSGSVAGSLRATRLRSQGTLSGKVEATDVFLSGIVRSNTAIKAKRLEVKLGSDQAQIEVTFGECALEVGDPIAEPIAVAVPAKVEPVKVESARPEPALAAVEGTVADGWALPPTELAGASAAAPTGNGNISRSPWKPSRTIDAGTHDAVKSTQR